MNITRRNALVRIGASLSAAASVPGLGLPKAASSGPVQLSRYFLSYHKIPVWFGDVVPSDFGPFLRSCRWHFDNKTYDSPLISCVDNGRVFIIHRLPTYGTMVFEVWIDGLINFSARDVFSDKLPGAARYAAAWACDLAEEQAAFEATSIYIDFAAGEAAPPTTKPAPPLIIHDRLSLSRWPLEEAEDEATEEDEGGEI